MAADGEILLLNCSAAASSAGKTMCRNLGQVLLGKRGGSVIASTVDIKIDQAYTWFSILGSPRTGKWITAGDVWVSGSSIELDIPARPDPLPVRRLSRKCFESGQSGRGAGNISPGGRPPRQWCPDLCLERWGSLQTGQLSSPGERQS